MDKMIINFTEEEALSNNKNEAMINNMSREELKKYLRGHYLRLGAIRRLANQKTVDIEIA